MKLCGKTYEVRIHKKKIEFMVDFNSFNVISGFARAQLSIRKFAHSPHYFCNTIKYTGCSFVSIVRKIYIRPEN